MDFLSFILLTILVLLIILNCLYLTRSKNSLEIVRDMGIGYNSYSYKTSTPEEQITLNGNTIPTKNMIKKIKKYGFKTIRFPITWLSFIDDYGNINSEWMHCVKGVIDLILKSDLYCILNIYNDGN